jgi:hypothetical protein
MAIDKMNEVASKLPPIESVLVSFKLGEVEIGEVEKHSTTSLLYYLGKGIYRHG